MMQHDLDDLARQIWQLRIVLCYGRDGARPAFRYRLPAPMRVAIRNHRAGLARLMRAGDWRLCPAPGLHRREWFYAGRGRYVCALCVQLDCWQMPLWQKGETA